MVWTYTDEEYQIAIAQLFGTGRYAEYSKDRRCEQMIKELAQTIHDTK